MRRAPITSLIAAAAITPAAPAGAPLVQSFWLSAASGSWTTPSNWSTNPAYPDNTLGGPYHAIIDASGAPYTIAIPGSITLDALTLDSPEATLAPASGVVAINLGGVANLNAGTLRLSRTWLFGGTWNLNGARIEVLGVNESVIDGAAVNGDLHMVSNQGRILFRNGATLNGDIVFESTALSTAKVLFDGDFTLEAGRVAHFDGPGNEYRILGADANGHTFTIEDGALVHGAGGRIYNDGSGSPYDIFIVNHGVISADAPGETLGLIGQVTNDGVIEAINGGALLIEGGLTTTANSLIRSTGAGSTVTSLYSAGGLFEIDGGTLSIYGDITTADWEALPLLRNGGVLVFSGDLNNQNDTLHVDATFGDLVLQGRIRRGTIIQTGAALKIAPLPGSGYPAEIYRSTLEGSLVFDAPGSALRIRDNADINGDIVLQAADVEFRCQQTVTLDPGQSIVFDGASGGVRTIELAGLPAHMGELVIGPGATVRGYNGEITGGDVINNGLLAADGPGPLQLDSWVHNNGDIRAENGATLTIFLETGASTSTLTAGPGGAINASFNPYFGPVEGLVTIELGGPGADRFGAIHIETDADTIIQTQFSAALIDNFEPTIGHTFDIISFDAANGPYDFSAIELPELANPVHTWYVEQSQTSVTIGVRHVADLDHDGLIGFSDLNIILGAYNTPGSPEQGDIDGDGFVGFADLNIVLSLYNSAAS